MTHSHPAVALLTDPRFTGEAAPGDWYHRQILDDDALLQKALTARELPSVRLSWDDPDADWSAFRALVFRTTWDYFERFAEFSAWFERVRTQTILINPPDALSWNMHKGYLQELQQKGVPVVPVRMIPAGSSRPLASLLSEAGWGEAVIKPAVSGGARLTYRIRPSNAAEVEQLLKPHLAREDFLLQPFMPDILTTGEDSLMVLNGEVTHAVRKVAKPGDYRVQDDHGGTVHPHTATPEQVQLALDTVQACGFSLAYARVDMVAGPGGAPLLMELEIIEPELWLRVHPPSADPFADAIQGRIGS
ncbi:MAG: hypothetical protein EA360_10565 [Balneolaceae bacterium]|nr:MAG: hypothetical protein EA360_10565 [Balneolaceae bacterium]